MKYRVQVIKDTPLHKEGEILSLKEFQESYCLSTSFGVILTEKNSIYFDSFRTIQDTFEIGDWVFHETYKKAYKVCDTASSMKPYESTFQEVNKYKNIYRRKALSKFHLSHSEILNIAKC